MYGKGAYFRAIVDGLLAQKKIDGDISIIAKDDPEFLKAVVSQGKSAEAQCREEGWHKTIERAYNMARVPLKEGRG